MNKTPKPTKEFRLVAISSNTGNFGHHGHLFIARDGTAVEGYRQRSPINPTNGDLNVGDVLTFEVDKEGLPTNWHAHHFEYMKPARQGNPPPALVEEVWSPNFSNRH